MPNYRIREIRVIEEERYLTVEADSDEDAVDMADNGIGTDYTPWQRANPNYPDQYYYHIVEIDEDDQV